MGFGTLRHIERKTSLDHAATWNSSCHVMGEPIRGFALGDVEVRDGRAADGRGLAFWIIPRVSSGRLVAEVVLPKVIHPNILRVFAAQRVGKTLVLTTERTESSLWSCYIDARAEGRPGIDRDLLVDLIADVARGLDATAGPRTAVPANRKPIRDDLGQAVCRVAPWTIALAGGVAKLSPVCPETGPVGLQAVVPAYLPPECEAGWRSRQSDQYSLAVAYCHLRGGRTPSPRSHDLPKLESAPDLTMIPANERRAVARALSPDPEKRWPACRTFVEALRSDILSGEFLGGSIEEEEAVPENPVADRKRRLYPSDTRPACTPGSIAPAVWLLAARGHADQATKSPSGRTERTAAPSSKPSLKGWSRTRSIW
jgi:hypothetical protein